MISLAVRNSTIHMGFCSAPSWSSDSDGAGSKIRRWIFYSMLVVVPSQKHSFLRRELFTRSDIIDRRMPANAARRWLVTASLLLCAAILVFFLLAPTLGYPLEFAQSMRALEIVLPVFLGYLGTAALFIFRSNPETEDTPPANVLNLVSLLVKGPIVVFGMVLAALLVAFGRLNSS